MKEDLEWLLPLARYLNEMWTYAYGRTVETMVSTIPWHEDSFSLASGIQRALRKKEKKKQQQQQLNNSVYLTISA